MDAREFGAFLASRRARIRPADVGLPTGPRRRVPGLRRDEVATLAGASVDYYTELERGRGAHPSVQMLAALARALRLSSDERDHLFHLAGQPAPATGGSADHVQPAMLALLDRLETTPARIITDLDVTLAQNRLGHALLGDPARGSGSGGQLRLPLVHRPGQPAVGCTRSRTTRSTRATSSLTCAPPARSSRRCGTAATSLSGGWSASGSCTRRSASSSWTASGW
jgi:transcriptional regulator with XRE-family HTH domain